MSSNSLKSRKTGQSSFTLIETIIALGLMVVIVLEVSAVQGRAISFSEFERKVTQATWLGKALMSHLEYKFKLFELKDIKLAEKDAKFPPELCPEDPKFDCDYKYDMIIEEWKLPIVKLAASSAGDSTLAGIIEQQLQQILGDEVLKYARVSVKWGLRQDSVELMYLLTAQYKLDQAIETLKPVAVKDPDKKDPDKKDPDKKDPDKKDPDKKDPDGKKQ